jgi:hypothetical protein
MADLTLKALAAFNEEYSQRFPQGGDEEDHHYAQVAAIEAAISEVSEPAKTERIDPSTDSQTKLAELRALPVYAKVRVTTANIAHRGPLAAIFRGEYGDGKFRFTATLDFFLDPDEITYLEVVSEL